MPGAVQRQIGSPPPMRSPSGKKIGGSTRRPTIDFKYLDGLAGRVDRELRDTEDALVAFVAAEEKRRALYANQHANLEDRYPALRAGR